MSQLNANGLAEFLRNAAQGQETIIDIANAGEDGAPLPEGRKIVVLQRRTLNPEMPALAPRMPSPPRAHQFYEVEGFALYLKKFGTKDTVLFANPLAGQMTAVLDECATDGFEMVNFLPQTHPVFAPWRAILLGEDGPPAPMPIRDFVDFLARNRQCMVIPAGKELVALLSQVRMSRDVEIHQGSGRASLNGILVRMKIEGGGPDRTDFVALPDTITIKAPIYLGMEADTLELDLTIFGDDKLGVTVRLSSSDLLVKQMAAFEKMFTIVRGIAEQATVVMGDPAHGTWQRIGR